MGPRNQASDLVGQEKYRGENEDHREMCNRVAGFLQDDHEHYMQFREVITTQRFSPPGRVLAGAGALKSVTLYNCFVMPTIHDSFVHGPSEAERMMVPIGQYAPESIAETGVLAATTMRQGGGVGYDFSTLRPAGDNIKGVGGRTDGVLAFMGVYDAYGRATSSAGNRRGAQMAVLRCDHPDIEAFIRAKQVFEDKIPWDMRPFRGFNMSVGVTDELMEAVEAGKPFQLKFNGEVYREVDAQALWDMIMRGTYDFAEPGVLFLDRINEMNNLYYAETIAATNPCGEQPLPPYGACLLGSFNLNKYIEKNPDDTFYFNRDQLAQDIPVVVRAMDNVIDRSRYPLVNQKTEAQRKRRMGLGITGLANALEALGHPYGTNGFTAFQDEIQAFITRECYRASAMLAKEKGAFPLYDQERYLNSKFIQTLDEDTIGIIKRYGIRNSHLTSIAPTGTISFYADNSSSGIEPVVAYKQKRKVKMLEGEKIFEVPDYGVEYFGVEGRTVSHGNITAAEHVAVLMTAQKHVDSAVSKTCNVPADFSFDDFKDLYKMGWESGCKGLTTYRPAGKYDEPIQAVDTPKVEAVEENGGMCYLDEFGQKQGACADG